MSVGVAVTGATGRMGRELLAAARGREDVDVALATSREPDAGPIEGIDLDHADLFADLLDARDVDVVVDFTTPAASVELAERCAAEGVPLVVGTTGFDGGDTASLRRAAESIPLLKAANFAPGVTALVGLVADAAAALDDYDVELLETHHRGKRDAPSGTAKRLLGAIEDAREDLDERVHGRVGHAPRSPGEVGVHARRAGTITGEHEVLLAGPHEELRLTHRAADRGVFAEGALDAAVWLAGRDPGWYDFEDVLGTRTDPTTDGGTEDDE